MQKKYAHWYLVLILIALAGMILFPKLTIDDAFISYRYGKNLVDFGELNWNPGMDPVEGYTGILLPLLAALILKFALPLLASIKVLGVLAFFGAAYLVRCILRQLKVGEPAILVCLGLWTLTPFLYLHSLSNGLNLGKMYLGYPTPPQRLNNYCCR